MTRRVSVPAPPMADEAPETRDEGATGRRLWIAAQCQTGPLLVYVTTDFPRDDEGVEAASTYRPTTEEIEVGEENGASCRLMLLHELLHVTFSQMTDEVRAEILGTDGERREELVVSYVAPVLFDLLNRNGWLRIPEPPKGDP